MSTGFTRFLPSLLLGVGTLLLLDLFLDWRTLSVTAGISVDAGESGWAGWGAGAGVLLVSLLAVEALQFVEQTDLGRRGDVIVLVLAIGVLALVVAAFADDAINVAVGPVSVVEGGREWPAWIGLILASVEALLALGRFVPEPVPFHHARHGAA
jgi:hypothetical protein